MKFTEFNKTFCKITVPLLKLQEETEKEILKLARRSNYNVEFCSFLVEYLQNPQNIDRLTAKGGYKPFLAEKAAKVLRRIKYRS